MKGLKTTFLLVWATAALQVQGQCPSPCNCPSSYTANCASASLIEIPGERFAYHMEILDISDNSLTALNSTSLRSMRVISLVKLNASGNSIDHIHQNAFLGHSKLEQVDLSRNSLRIIDPGTFFYNPSLMWLSLSGNTIKLPQHGSLLKSKSIRDLHLSNCNIHKIPLGTFKELPSLQTLYISHNKIASFGHLLGLEKLTHLDLSNNYLSVLNSDTFTNSPQLARLELSNNWLYTLNFNIVPQLTKVVSSENLIGNPWVCDCELFNTTYLWCRDNNIDLQLVCTSPPSFEGRFWSHYETVSCDDNNDPEDYYSDHDFGVDVIDETSSRLKRLENIEIRTATAFFPSRYHKQDKLIEINYFYTSIVLSCLCCGLILTAGILWYRLTSQPKTRTGPAKSPSETRTLQRV
ncbi:phospholipase A2 inhibitor beta-like [Periplaneta americana]|uniref:phospholipase A2 inhibitor beta-like n=1 Tax=Periplaneta americana TaxID=6978 RepID=UPI0037E8E33D